MLGAKEPWSQPHLSSEVLVMEGEWHKPYFYKQTIDILKVSEGERQIIWVGVSPVAPSGTCSRVKVTTGPCTPEPPPPPSHTTGCPGQNPWIPQFSNEKFHLSPIRHFSLNLSAASPSLSRSLFQPVSRERSSPSRCFAARKEPPPLTTILTDTKLQPPTSNWLNGKGPQYMQSTLPLSCHVLPQTQHKHFPPLTSSSYWACH